MNLPSVGRVPSAVIVLLRHCATCAGREASAGSPIRATSWVRESSPTLTMALTAAGRRSAGRGRTGGRSRASSAGGHESACISRSRVASEGADRPPARGPPGARPAGAASGGPGRQPSEPSRSSRSSGHQRVARGLVFAGPPACLGEAHRRAAPPRGGTLDPAAASLSPAIGRPCSSRARVSSASRSASAPTSIPAGSPL